MSKRIPGSVSLITPSYRGDLERSALLFESVDQHVRGFERHYVIVHDEDVALFKRFENGRRVVLPVSEFLPRWLHEIPYLRWRKRQYWWSLRSKPVSGWHTQQLVKIKAAASLPEERYCLINSDNVFFRAFDVSEIASPTALPLHITRGGSGEHRPRHLKWVTSAHRLLGLKEPTFPADDYIDQIIVWDRAIVNAMTARIELVTGLPWAEALCRVRDFSEYMIFGTFVLHEPSLRGRVAATTQSLCRTYWDEDDRPLGQPEILAMLGQAQPHEVALCIQSFNPTPLATIRASLAAFDERAAGVPSARLMA